MSPSPSPTFIFVPGAWHGPAAFSSTIHLLAQRGYPSSAVALKSVDASPPLQNFDPDVEAVRSAVEAVVSKGGDVVLVMHSYGGIPGSEAMKYFLDGNEGEDGRARRGRVVRMVWICAFVGPVGGCLFEGIGGKDLPWFRVDVSFRLPSTSHHIQDTRSGEATKRRSIFLPYPVTPEKGNGRHIL
jgi:pimeloyl-ACP methyl ester carboxylesterase